MSAGFGEALLLSFVALLVYFIARYTDKGLALLTEVKGFRMYLGTAEKNRLEALYPPKDSIDRFERLLPYALALGVGKTWANRFARYIKVTGEEAVAFHNTYHWESIGAFRTAGSYCSSCSSSESSSSGSDSKGSGSSGGGYSGGGDGNPLIIQLCLISGLYHDLEELRWFFPRLLQPELRMFQTA